MKITCAQPSDTDIVLAILDEAARWLQARGINQWPVPFPHAEVQQRFAEGAVYLALVDDQPAGTFSLFPSDLENWGPMPDDALYLHGLAVRRAFAGSGLGQALLHHAEDIAIAQGKRFLRLDCWAGNAALRRFYTAAGFRERGIVEPCVDGEVWNCRLFEKVLG
jgi:GNAT superfamily N-acetyltransferase